MPRYGVLLAFEAASKGYGAKGRELSTSDREQILVKTATSMGSTKAVFVLLELPDADREAVRKGHERTIRKAAGDDADLLIETVGNQNFGDEDDPNDAARSYA